MYNREHSPKTIWSFQTVWTHYTFFASGVVAWYWDIAGIFQRQLQENLVIAGGLDAPKWHETVGDKVLLMFSQHRLLFALCTQHTVCVNFAVLFLQCRVSSLQNISGCCQLKFVFCNAFGQGLYTQGRCFWSSKHMRGAPPRWISSSGNLVHLSEAKFFLFLILFLLTSTGLVLNFFPKTKFLPWQSFDHFWTILWDGQKSRVAMGMFWPKCNTEPIVKNIV